MTDADRRRIDSRRPASSFATGETRPRPAATQSFETLLVDGGLVPRDQAGELIRRARRERVSLLRHLIGEGLAAQDELYAALAAFHGLPYLPELEGDLAPSIPPTDIAQCLVGRWLELVTGEGRRIVVAAPGESTITTMRHIPGDHGRTDPFDAITTPGAVRRWIEARYADAMVDDAVLSLAETQPELSAQQRFGRGQRVFLVVLALAAAGALLSFPGQAAMALIGLCSAALAAGALPHLITFTGELLRRPVPTRPIAAGDVTLPTYTLLVPLFREPHMVERIASALTKLDYPRSRLDIKLILEADDTETVAAANARSLPGCFEILLTPPTWPRTKTKALAYGLAFARGRLVAVYDADDEPDADQLLRAAAAFAAGGPRVARLQARSTVVNAGDGWLARQAAVEYACLNHVALPAASRIGMPANTGGASVHYRVDALRRAGGWDPYNLGGDDDLGVRLARLGYRSRSIDSDTGEEAPIRFSAWFGQRLRRLRGSLQIYLVHMRRPLRALRELGPTRFLALQGVFGASFAAHLAHPILVVHLAVSAALGGLFEPRGAVFDDPMFVAGVVALLFAYLAEIEVAMLGLYRARRPDLLWQVALIPAYRMMASIAAYGAAWRFFAHPFQWEKTAHRGRRKPPLNPRRRKSGPGTVGRGTRRETIQRSVDSGGRKQRPHANHPQ